MSVGGGEDALGRVRLDLLVGPTGTGKSALGVRLAERLGREVVSMDSMLVYRGMDVGTAKPDAGERARVVHHGIDVADPGERYDLARYLGDVRAAVEDLERRGVRPLFVGGTALYLQSLLFRVFGGPAHDPELRARLNERVRSEGSRVLWAELSGRDPAAAERLHPNDARRIVRALEVLEQSGRPLSAWQSQWPGFGTSEARPHRLAILWGEGPDYEAALVERVRAMLAGGWIEEVRALIAQGGLGETASQALGYREVAEHLAGELPAGELAARIALRTRQFARRQRTWLRRFRPGALVIEGAPGGKREAERAAWAEGALERLHAHFQSQGG